jgi:hypothetical protein
MKYPINNEEKFEMLVQAFSEKTEKAENSKRSESKGPMEMIEESDEAEKLSEVKISV